MTRCSGCRDTVEKNTIYTYKNREYCRPCYFRIFHNKLDEQSHLSIGRKPKSDEGYPDYYYKGNHDNIPL